MPNSLPQLSGSRLFLTDGGLETTLIFHRGLELPAFAAFTLLRDERGRAELRDYFEGYIALAREQGTGFVLDTATWRANPDWGAQLGYDAAALDEINRDAVAFAHDLRERAGGDPDPIVISGVIGPRGDGYQPGALMSPGDAEAYHSAQVASFAAAGADMVEAITMNYVEEAIGIARAAAAAAMPVVISFTVETDGRLPGGETLSQAIARVDAATDAAPDYYMINCAHPSHFAGALEADGSRRDRIGGLRANASSRSHAELDEAEELDEGDPEALGADYAALRGLLPGLSVLGGCCGTDERHIAAVGAAWRG